MTISISALVTAAQAELADIDDLTVLEHLRVHYLGKKGLFTERLKALGQMTPEARREVGAELNQAKQIIIDAINKKKEALLAVVSAKKLQAEALDISRPGRGQSLGRLHPITQALMTIHDFFKPLGFSVIEGREIETEYYNFDALNIPAVHPARTMHDTFYCDLPQYLLRTHTSPTQIRYMESHSPPLRMIAPGRVYRCDSDATHTPMFHQLEGLMIDESINFAHLKAVLTKFMAYFFDKKVEMRFRPSYFPFTEPSAEADLLCVHCTGKGCKTCKNTGWLEVLGCGMVHPKVLSLLEIDPQRYSGFAFGVGIDRLAMLRYRVEDLRLFFENDLRFLSAR